MEPTELPFYFTEGGTLAKAKKSFKHLQEQKACRHKEQDMKSGGFLGIVEFSL